MTRTERTDNPMKLTNQGYYNLIMYVGEPEDMYQLFEPNTIEEEVNRLEDVEIAISFINDNFDVDMFNSYDSVNKDPRDLFMRAFILERIRFEILREDWEPMFNPFPTDPLDHLEPDVVVSNNLMMVRIRSDTLEHGFADVTFTRFGDNGEKYRADWHDTNFKGVEKDHKRSFTSDDIVEVAGKLHMHLDDKLPYRESRDLGDKIVKFLNEVDYKTDIEVNLEDL